MEGKPRVPTMPLVQRVKFSSLESQEAGYGRGGAKNSAPAADLARLADVNVTVEAVLGNTYLTVREILSLQPGSVVGLLRLAGEPVDVYINGYEFAHGEVVVINDVLGIRITPRHGEKNQGKPSQSQGD